MVALAFCTWALATSTSALATSASRVALSSVVVAAMPLSANVRCRPISRPALRSTASALISAASWFVSIALAAARSERLRDPGNESLVIDDGQLVAGLHLRVEIGLELADLAGELGADTDCDPCAYGAGGRHEPADLPVIDLGCLIDESAARSPEQRGRLPAGQRESGDGNRQHRHMLELHCLVTSGVSRCLRASALVSNRGNLAQMQPGDKSSVTIGVTACCRWRNAVHRDPRERLSGAARDPIYGSAHCAP